MRILSVILFLAFAVAVCVAGRGCSTKSGPEPGKPCVYPFTFKGTTYTTCTTKENDGQPWCSVQVDSNGNHVGGKWGNCYLHCYKGCVGQFDCKDAACISTACKKNNMYQIKGSNCLQSKHVNNGVNDCADGSDEPLQESYCDVEPGSRIDCTLITVYIDWTEQQMCPDYCCQVGTVGTQCYLKRGKELQPEDEIMPQIMITGKHFYAESQFQFLGCRNLCQATPKCKYWTFIKKKWNIGDCFLKEENTGLILMPFSKDFDNDGMAYSGVKLTKCESNQFDCKYAGCMNPDTEECIDGTTNCIWKALANNGVSNCKYGLDEGITVNCDGRFCCETRIQGDQECQGQCIPADWIDDGEEDCNNGADENQISVILDENSSN